MVDEQSSSLSGIFMDLALTASVPLLDVRLNPVVNRLKYPYLMKVDTGKAERYYRRIVRH
jgi:hypothetical protein